MLPILWKEGNLPKVHNAAQRQSQISDTALIHSNPVHKKSLSQESKVYIYISCSFMHLHIYIYLRLYTFIFIYSYIHIYMFYILEGRKTVRHVARSQKVLLHLLKSLPQNFGKKKEQTIGRPPLGYHKQQYLVCSKYI